MPVAVHGLAAGVQAIAALGGKPSALVNGGVQCWGYDLAGQLGNNSTTGSDLPVQVIGLTSGVHTIARGDPHSCALTELLGARTSCTMRTGAGAVSYLAL